MAVEKLSPLPERIWTLFRFGANAFVLKGFAPSTRSIKLVYLRRADYRRSTLSLNYWVHVPGTKMHLRTSEMLYRLSPPRLKNAPSLLQPLVKRSLSGVRWWVSCMPALSSSMVQQASSGIRHQEIRRWPKSKRTLQSQQQTKQRSKSPVKPSNSRGLKSAWVRRPTTHV